MSFQELKETFGLEKQDFFRYLQIRDHIMKEIKIDPKIELNGIIKIIVDAYHQGKSRVISAFYKALEDNRENSTLYLKNKWESELNIDISDDDWYEMCMTQCTTTSSQIWREFGWKNLTRFFITPQIKSR